MDRKGDITRLRLPHFSVNISSDAHQQFPLMFLRFLNVNTEETFPNDGTLYLQLHWRKNFFGGLVEVLCWFTEGFDANFWGFFAMWGKTYFMKDQIEPMQHQIYGSTITDRTKSDLQ